MLTPCASTADPAIVMFDVTEDRFAEHLRLHAGRFFAELDVSTTTVRLVQHSERHHSQLFDFEVADRSAVRNVIYKIPFSLEAATVDDVREDRPSLFSLANPLNNGLREYQALKSVEQHFSELDSGRFGHIAMFELLESPFVLVMEKCGDPNLKSLLRKSVQFSPAHNSTGLNPAFANTGAWLREFHTLSDLEHTELRHAGRDTFVDAVDRFCDSLVSRICKHSFFEQLRRRINQVALNSLPVELPCVVAHGDFAPRNILVGEESRITVFDTQRRWRAPLYEDLAYFLMSLKVPGPQVRSQGLLFSRRQLDVWESHFLNGYFCVGPVPLTAVRLYECLLTLEWWAAINFRQSGGRLMQRASLALSNRYLFRYFETLLASL